MREGKASFIERRARLARVHHAPHGMVPHECHVASLSPPSNPPQFSHAYPFLTRFLRSSFGGLLVLKICHAAYRRKSLDVYFPTVQILRESEVRMRELWLPEVGVSELFLCVFPVKIPVKRGMPPANRELHVVAGVVIFPTHPGSRVNLQRVGKTLCAKAALPTSDFNVLGTVGKAYATLFLQGFGIRGNPSLGWRNMVLRAGAAGSVFGPFGRQFSDQRFRLDPGKILDDPRVPRCTGLAQRRTWVRKIRSCEQEAVGMFLMPRVSNRSSHHALHNGQGPVSSDSAFDPVNSSVKLGQLRSNLVNSGQNSPNSGKCIPDRVLRVFGYSGPQSGQKWLRSNLGQTWSTPVKLGQPWSNLDPTSSTPFKSSIGFDLQCSYQVRSPLTHLIVNYHCFFTLATLHEPHTYRKASTNPLWKQAMTDELDTLNNTHTWDMTTLPPGKSVDFTSNAYDYALFLRQTSTSITRILLYVNDIIIIGDDFTGICVLQQFLSQAFEIKDLGTLNYFLGLEVTSYSDGYYLFLAMYASNIFSKVNLTNNKTTSSPLELNVKLTATDGEPLPDATLYQQLVGSLIYLIVTCLR
uniref:Reverse transcriptase Ty1/copia-type domain-containing protein n=1 Tax=Fagus sylvatica TaxID=28930 RepID=A0A2N9FXR8_FAGSY